MEPIAIVGIGCRFPGAKDPEAFWQLLCDGVDAISEIPSSRWELQEFYDPDPEKPGKMNSRYGGYLSEIDRFDPHVFGISPREAMAMDPQQRLLLEVAWEALEDAGQVLSKLAGSRTGVFIGISTNDYSYVHPDFATQPDGYDLTGNSLNIAAGRLSYYFNFRGPSMAIDTACSSSLVAVHLACQSLWNGESTMTLAAGANLILSPIGNIALSKLKALSPDGRCKAFDASANGYVRSEGVGCVVLKPLDRALADNDPIYATIRGSAVNHDGRAKGLTVPYGPAQEAVIRQALEKAGVAPSEISYIEAHGTGTVLGDPIEAIALGTVLAQGRPPESYCALGTVKSNIGHLEAAAGIASLIKVALSLKHQQIPPSLHFQAANPYIPFDTLPLRVQQTLAPWSQQSSPAKAGISSFGFAGTNAHVIVEEAPIAATRDRGTSLDSVKREDMEEHEEKCLFHLPYLLPLSAHNPEAIVSLARAYRDFLETQNPDTDLLRDICYTASVRRTHHKYRLALVANSSEELKECLETEISLPARKNRSNKLVFVFSGQGSQWWGMGRELLQQEPVFRAVIEECDALIRTHSNWSLLTELAADENRSRLQETEIAQASIFALQVALAQLWQSWGIEPKAVVGHSLGEIAAACVAGILSLADAVKLVCDRGRLMQQATGKGKMAAVELSWQETERLLLGYRDRLCIAAINSPTSTVVSGETEALESFLASVAQQHREVLCKYLPVNYAFHSHQVEFLKDELVETIQSIQPQAENIPFFSTVTGDAIAGTALDANYWGQNMRQPVRFAPAIEALANTGANVFLEISPHPVLLGYVDRCLNRTEREGFTLPSLRRGQGERLTLLNSLGTLYALGYSIDWQQFYPSQCRVVRLPAYPWQRERYWNEEKPRQLKARSHLKIEGLHPLLGQRLQLPLKEIVFESEISTELQPFLEGHQVHDRVILPGAVYLELALAAGAEIFGSLVPMLENVSIQEALIIPEGQSRIIQVIFTPKDEKEASFQILSRVVDKSDRASAWIGHATGTVIAKERSQLSSISLSDLQTEFPETLSVPHYYQQLLQRGLKYGASFQGIQRLWRCNGAALGQIELPEGAQDNAYQLHPVLIDSGLQLLFATLSEDDSQDTYLPIGLERLQVYRRPNSPLWSVGRMRPQKEAFSETRLADLQWLDESGQIIAEIEGLQVKRIPRKMLLNSIQESLNDWLYELKWEPKIAPGQFLSSDYLLAPQQASDRIQPLTTELSKQYGLENYDEFLWDLEALSTAYILKAFSHLGYQFVPPKRMDATALAEQLGIVPQHRRLLVRLLEILQEDGILKAVGNEWEVCRVPEPMTIKQPTEMLQQYPAYEAEVTLVERCGQKLAEVLRGWCDPIELLFPNGSLTTAEKLYQDSPGTRTFNLLVQNAIATLIEQLPEGRTIRVLEIGAGTGGTTSYVLSQLPAERTEYVFSDVAHLFMSKAKEKFANYPFVRYQILDIEQDIEPQGFAPHQFDLILAANVLHATSNLHQTLNRVRQLLTPQGTLVLLEGTGRQRWLDLTFGLTEGWWKFSDLDLRSHYPLLTPSQWQNLLTETGFTATATIPASENRKGGLAHQSVILARSGQVTNGLNRWLIFSDRAGIGQRLATQLTASGDSCILVFPGKSYQQCDRDRYTLNPSRPQDFEQLLKAVKQDKLPWRGIVHLWSLDIASSEKMAAADLETSSILGCRSVLHLLQSLVKGELSQLPSLWLVTQGAQPVEGSLTPVTVAQAPLWGLGKAIALEHPDLHCVQVDLDPASQTDRAKVLLDTLYSDPSEKETHLAFRQEQRYVLRLKRSQPLETQPLPIQSDATYLIAGGLGGLGLLVAQWLVQRGARQLVLLGRREASEQASTVIKELEQIGAKIAIARTDISQTEQVAKILAQIEDSMPPLKGIIHAAGALDVGLLARQEWESFARVLSPKVQGAWNLHALTQHLPLDFFILFSSVASILGSPGQGNHAAASTFLDALAHYRRALGLPALSINWGAWSEIGAVGQKNLSNLTSMRGMDAIAPQAGLTVLERIFYYPHAQVSVVPVQWTQFLEAFRVSPPLLTELAGETQLQATTEPLSERPLDFLQQLENQPRKRQELLLAFLREQVIKVLRLSNFYRLDIHQSVFDMGMDSLTSVELRNRLQTALGRSLSSTAIFDYPTVEGLAQYLASEMFSSDAQQEPELKQSTVTPIVPPTKLEQISEDEAEELLLKQLENLSY